MDLSSRGDRYSKRRILGIITITFGMNLFDSYLLGIFQALC